MSSYAGHEVSLGASNKVIDKCFDPEPAIVTETQSNQQIRTVERSYRRVFGSQYLFIADIVAYTVQSVLDLIASDKLKIVENRLASITCAKVDKEIVSDGKICYVVNGKIVLYTGTTYYHYIESNESVDEIADKIQEELQDTPLLRGSNFAMYGESLVSKTVNPVLLENVIIEPELKNDILDNTIFHMKYMEGNNGIIIHGDPGVGKTLAVSAIINESNKEGITTIVISHYPNFAFLEALCMLVSKAIFVFEDIESYSESREKVPNGFLAPFLQFLNGVNVSRTKMVNIAITNYFKYLDKAISERPMRFNRILEFRSPSNAQIDELIDLFYAPHIIDKQERELCYNKKISGAHIAEIFRTSTLLQKKLKIPLTETFTQSCSIVLKQFKPKDKTSGPGFRA